MVCCGHPQSGLQHQEWTATPDRVPLHTPVVRGAAHVACPLDAAPLNGVVDVTLAPSADAASLERASFNHIAPARPHKPTADQSSNTREAQAHPCLAGRFGGADHPLTAHCRAKAAATVRRAASPSPSFLLLFHSFVPMSTAALNADIAISTTMPKGVQFQTSWRTRSFKASLQRQMQETGSRSSNHVYARFGVHHLQI